MPALDHGLSELTPAGALTGIGSLPIVNPSEAIDFVAAYCPRLPFCPQPTSLDLVDGTLAQIGDVSRDLESTVRRFAEAAHNGAFPQAIALKTQLTGPITLSGLLSVREHGPTSADLLAALAERIAECASWQVENLRTIGLPVLVYVDEPALVLVASSDEPHVRALLGASSAGSTAPVDAQAFTVVQRPRRGGSVLLERKPYRSTPVETWFRL